MTGAPAKWDDLVQRIVSAIVMLVIGVAAVWAGGFWIHLLVALACALMVWELVRMIGAEDAHKARALAALSGTALFVASYVPHLGFVLPMLLAPCFVGWSQLHHKRALFLGYSAVILIAGFSLIALRDGFGIAWMIWLLLVVIVTDVAGYFAGRMLGGPKFWPRISPKKTWSGTVAGWIGAALVGLLFAQIMSVGSAVVFISMAIALASQLGDIAESAIKRSVGVKDSSTLIPGHGGLLDRFDGMLGAAVLLIVIRVFVDFPPYVLTAQ